MARDLTDGLIEDTLFRPDSVKQGNKNRLIAQKKQVRKDFGTLLVRVIYEESANEMVVVSAYWTRPDRYKEM